MNDQETKDAYSASLLNVKLGIGSWALSYLTHKGLIHYWDHQMGNPDYVGSFCKMATRYDYLRNPKTFNGKKLKMCKKCAKLLNT